MMRWQHSHEIEEEIHSLNLLLRLPNCCGFCVSFNFRQNANFAMSSIKGEYSYRFTDLTNLNANVLLLLAQYRLDKGE